MTPLRFALVFVFGVSTWCAASGWAAEANPQGVIALTTVTDYATVSATVHATDQFEARVATPGTVKAVMTAKGEFVEKGQPLAVVEDNLLKLRLQTLTEQTDLFRAHKAKLTQELTKQGPPPASISGTASPADIQRIQTAYSLQAAEEALRKAEDDRQELADFLAHNQMESPLSGQVAAMNLVTGSTVLPGDLLLVVAKRPILASLLLPGAKAGKVQEGMRLTLENLTHQKGKIEGKVTAVTPEASGNLVRVDISAPALQGQLLNHEIRVTLPVGEHQGILLSPAQLQTVEGKTLVALQSSGNVMVKATPLRPDGMVEILSGLQPGDKLATPNP